MLRRIIGVLVLAMGLGLGGWVAYNLLVELQPAAQGLSPVPAIVISVVFLYVGSSWARGRGAG